MKEKLRWESEVKMGECVCVNVKEKAPLSDLWLLEPLNVELWCSRVRPDATLAHRAYLVEVRRAYSKVIKTRSVNGAVQFG